MQTGLLFIVANSITVCTLTFPKDIFPQTDYLPLYVRSTHRGWAAPDFPQPPLMSGGYRCSLCPIFSISCANIPRVEAPKDGTLGQRVLPL